VSETIKFIGKKGAVDFKEINMFWTQQVLKQDTFHFNRKNDFLHVRALQTPSLRPHVQSMQAHRIITNHEEHK
jgi:hypothetical protein